MRVPNRSIIIFDEDVAPPINSSGGRSSIPDNTRVKYVVPPSSRPKEMLTEFYYRFCDSKAVIVGTIFWVAISILIEYCL